jgi:predicted dehydrogenase
MNDVKLSRRSFVKIGTAATAALTFPTIIPATALGKGGRPAPSERIHLACLGYGTIAYTTVPSFLNDERVQVVAVADPARDLPYYGYEGELRGGREVGKKVVEDFYAQQKTGGYKGCKTYEDFREMFDKEDIDAVNVSTPDHWHAYLAIYAARKGKHIYGQKPLALTVGEGRRMSDEVAKAGVTWQTGSQQRSMIYFRMACEFIRNQRLGKLQSIKVGLPGGHRDFTKQAAKKAPEAPPEGFNFDLWLGPAAKHDYCPALLPLNWRYNWDFSGGMITDWGAHHVDILQWALDKDASGPVKLENITAELPAQTDLYNVPTAFSFDIVYADGARAHVSNAYENGLMFEGEGGKTLFTSREKIVSTPPELLKDKIRDNEIRLYESTHHERNFVDHIYDGKPTVAPVETAHRSISICHLANIAIRLGRKSLAWDPVKEQVPGDDEANKLLVRAMRAPYTI